MTRRMAIMMRHGVHTKKFSNSPPMKAAIKRILIFVLAFVGLVMVAVLARIIDDSIDHDSFLWGVLQFFLALLEIVGFVGILFYVVVIVGMGCRAVVSKDPIEKTLSDENVKKEMKETAKLTILLLLAEFCATKFRDWWNKKS
jgi:hypothetical protein